MPREVGGIGPAAHASSIEAWSGVTGGINSCGLGGASYGAGGGIFGLAAGVSVGSVGNGISDCGLQGSTSDVIAPGGIVNSASQLNGATYGASNPGTSYSGSANSSAGFGILHAQASGSMVGDPYQGVGGSSAYAEFSDSLAINVNGLTSANEIFVSYIFNVDGSLTTDSLTSEAQLDMAGVVGGSSQSTMLTGSADATHARSASRGVDSRA